ncbi:MAG TPA: SPFH domain-containing protein [Gemmatimonadales bacterium]|nr:SPFH domain-containing protein [Gemmatimonadales bacterium]
MIREQQRSAIHGVLAALLLLALAGLSLRLIFTAGSTANLIGVLGGVFLFVVAVFCFTGLFIVNPNEGAVLTLFGRYVGTVKLPGLWWVNPFMAKKKVSLRVRNFETGKLKVNDSNSNPIEIAAVVVWKVVDTAEAMFEVDDYEHYVRVQSESAVRTLASSYPYDAHSHGEVALSTHTAEVSKGLLAEVQERLGKAGVQVTEARISHLAYAPEIASAMLQRQQASAVIAARQKIVEGAVGMVEMALEMLSSKKIIDLDPERRAAMVSNLLVVLCSERGTTPVVNAGTLYS